MPSSSIGLYLKCIIWNLFAFQQNGEKITIKQKKWEKALDVPLKTDMDP